MKEREREQDCRAIVEIRERTVERMKESEK